MGLIDIGLSHKYPCCYHLYLSIRKCKLWYLCKRFIQLSSTIKVSKENLLSFLLLSSVIFVQTLGWIWNISSFKHPPIRCAYRQEGLKDTKECLFVTCYHKMSVKSPDCIQRCSLLNMWQNNRKQRKINTKYWLLLDGTRNNTHISYIILKLALWRIWICNNFEKQLLLLYAHFVIAGHIYGICSLMLYFQSQTWKKRWYEVVMEYYAEGWDAKFRSTPELLPSPEMRVLKRYL